MQDQFRDKDFEIIGVNTDDEPVSAINSFRDQMKLNYTLVWGDTTLQNELLKISKFPGIPQSFLIDRDGKLRGEIAPRPKSSCRTFDLHNALTTEEPRHGTPA